MFATCSFSLLPLSSRCFLCGRDSLVGVELRLVEGGPGDPHVQDGQPGEAESQPAIRLLLRGVSCLGPHVEGQEEADNDADCQEDVATDSKVVILRIVSVLHALYHYCREGVDSRFGKGDEDVAAKDLLNY